VRRLLLTGGSGLLGRAVKRAAAGEWEVHAPTHAALDVRDATAVDAAVRALRPAAVIHTAYVRDGAAAWATIVDGSAAVARAAEAVGARIVHVSSDALFAGRPAAYTEHDAPDPVHDYGRAKAAAEEAVTALAPSAVLVRTSLLYGGADSPPVRMVLDALRDPPASATRFFVDEIRSFAHVDDVARALVVLAELDVAGPLHVAGPLGLSRYDFARQVCAAYGQSERHPRAGSLADLTDAGRRPGCVVLDCSRAAALVPLPGPVTDRLMAT
jgi:dTDP-4-dehydrorhamnose reductase